jgi:molybdenum cofactor cytidylyltransferase
MNRSGLDLGAIVLAAGLSTRMGKPKMLLPWGEKTVLEAVIEALFQAGITNPLVVVGAESEKITRRLKNYAVQIVFNLNYVDGEMLHSLQAGLSALSPKFRGVFIALGDQPQIQPSTIQLLAKEYHKSQKNLIIPSYQMRRGHPWLVGSGFWTELLELNPPSTLRDFIQKHAAEIDYVKVDTPTILADLDTPEDYEKYQPV